MNKRFFNQQNLTRRLRLLSVLFAMLLMPLGAWAEDYNVVIGTTQITDANKNDVLGDGGSVKYVPLSPADTGGTLTLDNATINGKVRTNYANLTIELIGKNTIAVADTSALATWYAGTNLVFTTSETSPGSLTMAPGADFLAIDNYRGFNITYQNGLSLIPTTPEAGETAVVGVSYGLTVAGIQVTNANVSNVLNDDETATVSFNASTNTLTLNGATIGSIGENKNIVSNLGELTIHFIGVNTIYGGIKHNTKKGGTLAFTGSESCSLKIHNGQSDGQSGPSIYYFTSVDFGSFNLASNSHPAPYYLIDETNPNAYQLWSKIIGEGNTVTDLTLTTKTVYPLWIRRTLSTYEQITEDNVNDVLGNGKVSFNGEHTLTLSGAALSGNIISGLLSGLTIIVDGENSIDTSSDSVTCIRNYAPGAALTLQKSNSETPSLSLKGAYVIRDFSSVSYTEGGLYLSAYSSKEIGGEYQDVLAPDAYFAPDGLKNAYRAVFSTENAPNYKIKIGNTSINEATVINSNNDDITIVGDGSLVFSVDDNNNNILTLDNVKIEESIISTLPNLTVQYKGDCMTGEIVSTNSNATLTIGLAEGATDDTKCFTPLTSILPWGGFAGNPTLNDKLVYIPGDDSHYIKVLSHPMISNEEGIYNTSIPSVVHDPNTSDEIEIISYYYTIDYVDETKDDVSIPTKYVELASGQTLVSEPAVLTAYAHYSYNGMTQDSKNIVGKYFGFATESVSGYAGQESIPFSLVPAINIATDGLTLGIQTGNEDIVAEVNDAYDAIILGNGLGLTYFRVTMTPDAETPYTILNYKSEGTANIGPLDVKVSVAAPTVSPDATGGPFDMGQLVTLGYEYEPNNDVHSIKYILGTDLTVAPTTYTEPFALNESTAVNAWVETTYSGSVYKSDTITVNFAIKQDPKLKVSSTWTRLRFGETFSQEVTSDMPTTPTVTWSSSNTDVATVDPTTGVVTPVAADDSEIEITATFAGDDTWSAASVSYAVLVDKAEQYLRIKYKGTNIPLSTVKVEKGNPIDIKTEYDFSCPEELVGSLVWYSNDENVVTVTNGVITTVGCGSTWIKVSSAGNSNYESDYCDFNIEVAPPKPTINLAEGTYMSTHDPITITKADIANTAITYTWDDVTDYNVSPTWKDYTDAGVALQKTGTLYARVGYTTNDEGVIYSDTASVAYTVIPDIAECTVSGNDNVTYTGAAQTPTITVTPAGGGETLVLGTDYTVSYKKGETAVESMIDAGDYTIVITAKEGSAYGGTKEVGFTIDQANLGDVTIAEIADQTYTGSQITPTDITVTFNGNAVSEDEYTISYGTNINVGEGTVTLTSKNKNFSTTSTKGATFTIVAKTLTADMVISVASVTYTGSAVEPELTIRDGDLDLEKGTDYTVIYSDNVSAGTNTAKATITGKGNYTGSADKMFTINKAQLTVTPDDKTYNVGDNIELTVSYDGFVDGDDEDVLTTEPTASYGTADVTKPGSYEITASGGVAQNYDFVYETGTLTINRVLDVSFASNTWATYCGTENLATPEGLKAYQVTAVEGATVTISEISYIPANTAVLLQNVSNNNVWTDIAASAYTGATSTFENNKLIGTASAVDVSTITGGTVYILVNNMFRRSTSGTIPANRGYLVVAASSNAPQLSISIGDENTTAISNTDFTDNTDKAGEWYSIDGVKLNGQPQKPGLYIKNGKKVFINKK